MLLTKKGLMKIIIMAICYFLLGSGCIAVAVLFYAMGIDAPFLFVLGLITYALDILLVFWGRYAEGKGKIINLGNKLVRNELRPAEFIKEYESIKNSEDLVIAKPEIELLQLVMVAYDCLGDRENCLRTVDEMIAVADEKKKAYVNLIRTSMLFSMGEIEEAEKLFIETQKLKLNVLCKTLVDDIIKCDRAIAMGDYKIAEAYNLRLLEQTFPKPDNLGKLVVYYRLGGIYEKLDENKKAVNYYEYCVVNGGETAIRISAKNAIEKLKSV